MIRAGGIPGAWECTTVPGRESGYPSVFPDIRSGIKSPEGAASCYFSATFAQCAQMLRRNSRLRISDCRMQIGAFSLSCPSWCSESLAIRNLQSAICNLLRPAAALGQPRATPWDKVDWKGKP
jgi:hypothetical protein